MFPEGSSGPLGQKTKTRAQSGAGPGRTGLTGDLDPAGPGEHWEQRQAAAAPECTVLREYTRHTLERRALERGGGIRRQLARGEAGWEAWESSCELWKCQGKRETEGRRGDGPTEKPSSWRLEGVKLGHRDFSPPASEGRGPRGAGLGESVSWCGEMSVWVSVRLMQHHMDLEGRCWGGGEGVRAKTGSRGSFRSGAADLQQEQGLPGSIEASVWTEMVHLQPSRRPYCVILSKNRERKAELVRGFVWGQL